jgi:hypothetical protein
MNEAKSILLSSASLHPAVSDLISASGVEMVMW